MVVLFLTGIMMGLFTGCIQEQNSKVSISQTTISDSTLSKEIVSDSLVKNENITEGTDNYRGFIIDNVLHSEKMEIFITMFIFLMNMTAVVLMPYILRFRVMKDCIFKGLLQILKLKRLDLKHKSIIKNDYCCSTA